MPRRRCNDAINPIIHRERSSGNYYTIIQIFKLFQERFLKILYRTFHSHSVYYATTTAIKLQYYILVQKLCYLTSKLSYLSFKLFHLSSKLCYLGLKLVKLNYATNYASVIQNPCRTKLCQEYANGG